MTRNYMPRFRNIRPVSDIKHWKKWWSMRLMILTAIFQTSAIVYASMPYDFTEHFPTWMKAALGWGALMTAISAAIARVIQQPDAALPDVTNQDNPYRNY